jgi:hypothetical protein
VTEQNSHLLMVGKMVSMNWNENMHVKQWTSSQKKDSSENSVFIPKICFTEF